MVDLDRLERVLIEAARQRRPVTYGQLLAFFGRRVTPVTVAALCRDLGRVGARVAARGGPELACLVVRKADGLPGEGWFAWERKASGYQGPSTGPAAARLVQARQAAAFAHFAPRKTIGG
jgi:hypothetical protein